MKMSTKVVVLSQGSWSTLHTVAVFSRLMHSSNITYSPGRVEAQQYQGLQTGRPLTFGLTGLSGAGKSTIAVDLELALVNAGVGCFVLDGDNVRHGLCGDLGFSEAAREENVRRVAEVAALMNAAGLVVVVSLISPRTSQRVRARTIIGEACFREVFISTPMAVCEQRDPKGLYKKARQGLIPEFTGISSPYEAPEAADLTIDTTQCTRAQAVTQLLALLQGTGRSLA